MSTEESKTIKPPYLSFVTLANFLKGLQEGVIPDRIDKSLMPGQSGATQSYLLSALAFFGLIDQNGKPQEDLEPLVSSGVTGDEARPIWKKLFERSFRPFLNGLDLNTATASQLLEKFKVFEYNGDTLRKCHVFFLALADAAGIPLAKHLRLVSKVAAVRKGPKKPRTESPEGSSETLGSDSSDDNSFPDMEGHSIAELPLNRDRDRVVRLQAPTTITSAELKRIQSWLSFQLIVEGDE